MTDYRRDAISNGNPDEQALIRRWWHEAEGATGRLVWEYYLEGRYADAIWFPCAAESGVEADGRQAPSRSPLDGAEVVLCEAKLELTPELVGQALVYSEHAVRAGARLRCTIVFAASAAVSMRRAAANLGLYVAVAGRPVEPPKTPLQPPGFAGG